MKKTKIQASCTLLGEDFEIDYVTKTLCIQPTFFQNKDDLLRNGKKCGYTAWVVDTQLEESINIGIQLDKVIMPFFDKADVLNKLSKDCKADWNITFAVYAQEDDFPMMKFSKEQLKFLAAIETKFVDIDFYLMSENEVEEEFVTFREYCAKDNIMHEHTHSLRERPKPTVEVRLMLSGNNFDADYITQVLGIQPTNRCNKNKKLESGTLRECTKWEVRTQPEESINIERQLNAAIAPYLAKMDLLGKLRKEYDAEWHIIIAIHVREYRCPIIGFSKEQLKFFGAVEADVRIDYHISP